MDAKKINTLIEKIQIGDVVLTNRMGINWGSLPIKIANFFKRGYEERNWTHAAIYIGSGKIIEAFPGGIVKRDLNESYLQGNYNLLVLRHKNTTNEMLNKAIAYCTESKGLPYDFRALVYFLLYNIVPHQAHFLLDNDFMDLRFNVKNAYFCSELVSEGFLRAGIYCFEKAPYKVMPIDFHNDLLFDLVERVNIDSRNNGLLWNIKRALFFIFYLLSIFLFAVILFGVGFIILALIGGWKDTKISNSETNKS
jgi:hypothetical protein